MEGLQYLSASIWAITTALSLILVIIAIGVYFWYRARVNALDKDEKTVAGLAAMKNKLDAEIEHCLKWLDAHREELLKLDDQRKEQLALEQELAKLLTELAQKEQNVDRLRREASELQNVLSSFSKDRDGLEKDCDRLESEKVDFEKKRDKANEQAKAAEEIKVQALIKAKDAEKELNEKRSELIGLNDKIIGLSLKRDSFIKEIRDKESKLDDVHQILAKAKIQKKKAMEEGEHYPFLHDNV